MKKSVCQPAKISTNCEGSLRDLNKAYIAFCGIPEDIQPLGAVATGNW